MSSQAMYGGGKGGGGGMYGAGKGGTAPADPAAPATPAATPEATPAAPAAPQGPTAFETGLNAQNAAMDFYQNQMGPQGSTPYGDYYARALQNSGPSSQMMQWFGQQQNQTMNPELAKMIGNLGGGGNISGGGGGGPSGPAYTIQAPGKELYDYDPNLAQAQSYQAAQLKDADLSSYMNPYTDSVIDSAMGDLDKARQTALNNTGAAASRGGAFGGDRHGVMEAQNNRDYMDSVARTSSNLRNQAFQNAQAAAMGDINAMNTQRSTNAQMGQQTALANAAAQNARDQFTGGLASQNQMAAEQANLQSATSLGQAGIAAGAQMAAARMAQQGLNQRSALQSLLSADQFNRGMEYEAGIAQLNSERASQDREFAAANALQGIDQFNRGMQYDAANQFYNMGGDRWNMAQNAVDNMQQVGDYTNNLNQTLIDQQRAMFENQANAPQQQYQQMLAALSSLSGGGTQSYEPGVFDYLKAGTSLFGIGK